MTIRRRLIAAAIVLTAGSVVVQPVVAQAAGTPSETITLTCTGSPCPWGATASGIGVVWPQGFGATSSRLGYTLDKPAYLPDAEGATVTIDSGSAKVYSGLPSSGSHLLLASLSAGNTYRIPARPAGEVVSVIGPAPFTHTVTAPTGPPPPPPDSEQAVQLSLDCTGSPCPWGSSISGHAAVWPAYLDPTSTRLGYTASAPAYLPDAYGAIVTVTQGSASLYAGLPSSSSHRKLADLSTGQSHEVTNVAVGEVVSLIGSPGFWWRMTDPTEPPPPPCTDPLTCDVVHGIASYSACNIASCNGAPWPGGMISWPSWSATTYNGRSGNSSRSVFNAVTDEPLYPYMGSWADGCEVTVESGLVLIVEWEHGTDVWRETYLEPGDVYTIDLVAPEDGALIEGATPFSVSLKNCDPQPIT